MRLNEERKEEQETDDRNRNGRQELDRYQECKEVISNRDKHKNRAERWTRKERENSVDYIYTGEWTLYAGILGNEEELNNYERWETHEGNTEITELTRYVDWITHIA